MPRTMRRLSQWISFEYRDPQRINSLHLITHAARITLSASRDRGGHSAQWAAPPRDVSRPAGPRARRGARAAMRARRARAAAARGPPHLKPHRRNKVNHVLNSPTPPPRAVLVAVTYYFNYFRPLRPLSGALPRAARRRRRAACSDEGRQGLAKNPLQRAPTSNRSS